MMIRTVTLAALLLAAAPATAAERNYSVTSFDRIRVDGPYRVKLTTGVAPFAKATGSAAAIEGVSIAVQGRTLVIQGNPSAWGGYPGQSPGPVELAVGTHEISTAWLNGAGALSVSKVKGLSFDIAVQGSGSVAVADLTVDQLKLGISGMGSATIAGSAQKATAIIRGNSSLDASALNVKELTLGADGGATIKAVATDTAKVDARGTAGIELAGSPACIVNAQGSATVSGCR
jgi:hypothetical protein